MISQFFLSLAKILSNRSEKKLKKYACTIQIKSTWALKLFDTKLVKKKINIPSGALFKIPAKHLADSDLV